jgi:glutathione S-transferase
VAAYAAIPLEAVSVDTNADPQELLAANPLGKIPTLLTDDGETVFDSRVITQYLNRLSGGKLFPAQSCQAPGRGAAGSAGRRNLRLPAGDRL